MGNLRDSVNFPVAQLLVLGSAENQTIGEENEVGGLLGDFDFALVDEGAADTKEVEVISVLWSALTYLEPVLDLNECADAIALPRGGVDVL